jgi:hypothetical protein
LLRYISYVLSVVAAFSLGTVMVLLRDFIPSNGTHSRPEIVQGTHSTGAVPMVVTPVASRLTIDPPEAAPGQQVLSAVVPNGATSDQTHGSAASPEPVALTAPDPSVLSEAVHPVPVVDTVVAAPGKLSSDQDGSIASVPVEVALPATGPAPRVSLDEPLRKIATRAVDDRTLKTGSIRRPGLSDTLTAPVQETIRGTKVGGEGRATGDGSLRPAAPEAPAQGRRTIRRVKQSPPTQLVSLPINPPQISRSTNEGSERRIAAREQPNQIQLPQALRPALP